jgi:hypothetical protein
MHALMRVEVWCVNWRMRRVILLTGLDSTASAATIGLGIKISRFACCSCPAKEYSTASFDLRLRPHVKAEFCPKCYALFSFHVIQPNPMRSNSGIIVGKAPYPPLGKLRARESTVSSLQDAGRRSCPSRTPDSYTLA